MFQNLKKIPSCILRSPKLLYRLLKAKNTFGRYGYWRKIGTPYYVYGGENIMIGEKSTINKYAWLIALPLTGEKSCRLVIGDRCRIQFFSHIVATRSIEIGNNVNIANSVYISDNAHGYEDINIPPRDQPIVQKNNVVIGDDTWIGERVVIMGCRIGKHCVIGSHSVVTRDIPDYSVVAGCPAKVIKRYNFETHQWEKVKS